LSFFPGIKHKTAAFCMFIFLIVFVAILALPTKLFFSEAVPDKQLHAVLFFVIPVIVWLSFESRFYWQFFMVLALAMLSEWLQFYIPYRDASLEDFFANLIGMFSAYSLILLANMWRKWRA